MELNLLDLPNEILVEIFRNLRTHELLKLTETCKKFNSLVGTTKILIKKVPLQISCRNFKNPLFIEKSSRKYQKINIKYFRDENFAQVLQLITSIFNSCVNKIKFTRSDFSVRILLDILKVTKNLKLLELDQTLIRNYENLTVDNVTNLKITNCNREILKTVNFSNLECLNLEHTPFQLENWQHLLVQNRKIRKLIVKCTFGIDLSDRVFSEISRNLVHLEHLEILDKYVNVNNSVYKIIGDNCKNLKYLKMYNTNITENFSDADRNYLKSKNIECELYNDVSLYVECYQM